MPARISKEYLATIFQTGIAAAHDTPAAETTPLRHMTQKSDPSAIANAAPSTSLPYEQMAERQRQAVHARRARERRRNVRLSVVSFVILTSLLALGFNTDVIPRLLRQSRVTNKTSVDDFASTRQGTLRSLHAKNTCRELRFDNKTGKFVSESYLRCDSVNTTVKDEFRRDASPAGRLNAIRDAFTR